MTVNNQGSTGNGIDFLIASGLTVENCVISGFSSGDGIHFNGPGTLAVANSTIRNNQRGIHILSALGMASGAVDKTRLEGNTITGLFARAGTRLTVRDSIASGSVDGFRAESQNSGSTELTIESCVAANNFTSGIGASSTSSGSVIVRVSDSTVTDNGVGLNNLGSSPFAMILSRGNNTVEGNGADTSGAIGSYPAK